MNNTMIDFEHGAGDVKSEREKLPDWFVHSPLLNVHAGLNNSETAEYLLSAMDIFLEHAYSNISDLEKYYQEGQYDNVKVMLHALKSTSRIIGAMILSTMSGAMEKALIEQDNDYIQSEFPLLIHQYKKYADLFNSHKKIVEKKEMPEGELEDTIMALKEYAQAEDFSLMESGLDYLESCIIPPETEKIVADLKQELFKLDWESISDILKKV